MRVQLIKESTGFGYGSKVIQWLVQDSENINTANRLKEGQICEIPDKVAIGFHNIVNVETGEIISLSYNLQDITKEEIKEKYQIEDFKQSTELKKNVSKILKATKPKIKYTKEEENNDY